MLTSFKSVILQLCLSIVCSVRSQLCWHRVAEVVIWTYVSYGFSIPRNGSRTWIECPNKAVILKIIADTRQVESYWDVKAVQQ